MADPGSTSAFYAARPQVLLDGRVDVGATDGLLTLLVEETTAGLYRCEATFGNWGTANGQVDFLYFDRRTFDFGKTLAIRIGDQDTAAQIFEGRIMALQGTYPQSRPPEFGVLAEDRFQDLRMTRRSRTFEAVSDSDVIQQVAAQHGLRTEVDVNGPSHTVLAQVNQSDLAFLRERARAIDAEIWLQGDTLHAQARAQRNAGEVTLTYGQRLKEFSVLADLAGQRTSLAVSGWDVSAKEAIDYEASASAISAELNGDHGGSNLLQMALGERVERLVHTVPLTTQEAQFQAEAQYRLLARRFVTGQGLAEGDGRLRVGTRVRLQGLGNLFNGAYYVTEVRHTFDSQSGYLTHFVVERPGLGSV
jgi:phage protein D